jgi:hypothetical protein
MDEFWCCCCCCRDDISAEIGRFHASSIDGNCRRLEDVEKPVKRDAVLINSHDPHFHVQIVRQEEVLNQVHAKNKIQ